jgi:hypothetical protein
MRPLGRSVILLRSSKKIVCLVLSSCLVAVGVSSATSSTSDAAPTEDTTNVIVRLKTAQHDRALSETKGLRARHSLSIEQSYSHVFEGFSAFDAGIRSRGAAS